MQDDDYLEEQHSLTGKLIALAVLPQNSQRMFPDIAVYCQGAILDPTLYSYDRAENTLSVLSNVVGVIRVVRGRRKKRTKYYMIPRIIQDHHGRSKFLS